MERNNMYSLKFENRYKQETGKEAVIDNQVTIDYIIWLENKLEKLTSIYTIPVEHKTAEEIDLILSNLMSDYKREVIFDDDFNTEIS